MSQQESRWAADLRTRTPSKARSQPCATAKGCLSNRAALAMVFKLVEAAHKDWRRLDGRNQLPKLMIVVKFSDGLEVTAKPDRCPPTTTAA
jgi:putative transposase